MSEAKSRFLQDAERYREWKESNERAIEIREFMDRWTIELCKTGDVMIGHTYILKWCQACNIDVEMTKNHEDYLFIYASRYIDDRNKALEPIKYDFLKFYV